MSKFKITVVNMETGEVKREHETERYLLGLFRDDEKGLKMAIDLNCKADDAALMLDKLLEQHPQIAAAAIFNAMTGGDKAVKCDNWSLPCSEQQPKEVTPQEIADRIGDDFIANILGMKK